MTTQKVRKKKRAAAPKTKGRSTALVARTSTTLRAPVDGLFGRIAAILEKARDNVVRAVNSQTVAAYWLIGREIVEAIQGGDPRAGYGARVIEALSQRMTVRYGKGFSLPNLWRFRQFYLAYPERLPGILSPPGRESGRGQTHSPPSESRRKKILSPPGRESQGEGIRYLVGSESRRGFNPGLSWSHYRALMGVEKLKARTFYEEEAVACGWSKVQLERQIETLYYERLLISRDKKGMLTAARQAGGTLRPIDTLKDPMVLEFLDLPDTPTLHESKLEAAIIANMQNFLLELGKGFSFVARQKRMRLEDEDFYVDLVFYNYLLRCFVLLDLKVGKLTHQDIGQMDTYVRMFEAHEKLPGDNPTIGLILCSKKNEAVVRYSVLKESRQLFAARYLTYLPTEEQLTKELERERRLIEERHESGQKES